MPHRDPEGFVTGKPRFGSISYDVELSFLERPRKQRLDAGTLLARLDFPVTFGIFMGVWWTRKEVMAQILQGADESSAALRREWQHSLAMPKAHKGSRTRVVEIVLTEPVYAWVGIASPLYNKRGGAEQVFLPNLARGAGPNLSNYARLNATYLLPVE